MKLNIDSEKYKEVMDEAFYNFVAQIYNQNVEVKNDVIKESLNNFKKLIEDNPREFLKDTFSWGLGTCFKVAQGDYKQ